MPKHRISKYAICPHYLHEDSQVIYCEGVVPDSVVHLAFANKTVAKDYKSHFCRNRYGECPIHQLLEEVQKDE